LHYISRTAYRDKASAFTELSANETAKIYLLPEGGSNELSLKGVGEIVNEVKGQMGDPPAYWVCPAGSGGTAAGLLRHLDAQQKLLVFPALKGNWMGQTILGLIGEKEILAELQIIENYHFGGYAKHTNELIQFMLDWYKRTRIALDPIYNAKAIFGLVDLVKKDAFPIGSRILILHTGGLQGIPGFNQRNALQLPGRA